MGTRGKRNKAGAFGPNLQQRRVKTAVQSTEFVPVESSDDHPADDEDENMQIMGSRVNSVAPPWFVPYENRIGKGSTDGNG